MGMSRHEREQLFEHMEVYKTPWHEQMLRDLMEQEQQYLHNDTHDKRQS